MRISFRLIALALTLLWVPRLAAEPARDSVERGITAYQAGYFVDMGANNALDMVRYTPGFAFQDADRSRGYSGAGGNVLIDGRRPSTKTTGLRAVLRQIPVEAIERIEVIRGSTPGIDMQGHSTVANVIRDDDVSGLGALQGTAKFYPNGRQGVTARLEKSRRTDGFVLGGWIEARKDRDDDKSGDGSIARVSATGDVIEQGDFETDSWTHRLRGLGLLEKGLGAGLLRANLALTHDTDDDTEITSIEDSSGQAGRDVVDKDSRLQRVELGVDYDGPVGKATGIQLVALQTLSRDMDDSTRRRAEEVTVANEAQDSGESILRGLLRRRLSTTFNLEGGVEVAYNFLDAESRLMADGQTIALPSSNVRVEELRGEIFSTLMLQPTAKLSVELGLRAENSRITVSGDAESDNRFTFFKPRIIAAYAADGGRQITARVEREVGQLDFDDFAASSELGDGTVNAGNPDLKPEKSWVFEGSYEQPFLGDGAVTLTYRHIDIEDVVDLVPVQGFAAPGNIGAGTKWEVAVAMTLPMDEFGPGLGRLQVSATWRDSEVMDPVSGTAREISGEPDFDGDILYTRDFPSLDSTFSIEGELTAEKTSYRIGQTISKRTENSWRLNWDWRARADMQVRLQLRNVTSRDRWLKRVRYVGTRADGIVASRESRSAEFDPLLAVRVRWTF